MRPNAADILGLAGRSAVFSVSNKPASDGTSSVTWLELLANGLTFDLERLAPSEPRAIPGFMHLYDLPAAFDASGCEAITLEPGPHLEGGENLLPVIRSQVAVAVELATLPGIAAIGWEPARSLNSPEHFSRSVTRWLEGGVFPGLGLTALAETQEGGFRSEGLAFFIGQELAIAPEISQDKASAAKLALRLFHQLVETGAVTEPQAVIGPEGEDLMLEPAEDGKTVRIRGA